VDRLVRVGRADLVEIGSLPELVATGGSSARRAQTSHCVAVSGDSLEDRIAVGTAAEAEVALVRLLGVTRAAVERSGQLQQALESRIVIEQAKGVLAERFDLDVDAAFELLRRGARSHRRRLRDLAAEVVASRDTPPEISALV
jgi:hypothetical protein